jgi:hypothetical protein
MKITVAKNKFIEITIKNGRDLILLHNIDSIKITKERQQITRLDLYEHSYQVGQMVEMNVNNIKQNYLIKHITQISDTAFELSSCNLTKSSVFLLPLVAGKKDTQKNYFFNIYLYNCYYRFDNQPEYNDDKHLFLVYRFFSSDYFKDLEEHIRANPNFIKTFEPSTELTTYILEVPLMFQDDVRKILKGQYSKISTTAKSRIMTFHAAHIESELSHILFKKPQLKLKLEEHLGCNIPEDVELCSRPELHKEKFIYEL